MIKLVKKDYDYRYLRIKLKQYKILIKNWVNSDDAANNIIKGHNWGYAKGDCGYPIILYKGNYILNLDNGKIYKEEK